MPKDSGYGLSRRGLRRLNEAIKKTDRLKTVGTPVTLPGLSCKWALLSEDLDAPATWGLSTTVKAQTWHIYPPTTTPPPLVQDKDADGNAIEITITNFDPQLQLDQGTNVLVIWIMGCWQITVPGCGQYTEFLT